VTSGRYPILVATLAIVLVGAVAATAIVHSMWRNAVDDAEVAVGNVAAILSEQTLQSVHAVDLVLHDLVDHVAWQGIETREDLHRELATRAQHDALTDRLDRLDSLAQVKAIAIVDSAGDSVVSTRGWPTPAVNVSGRDPFEYLRTHRDPSLVVVSPSATTQTATGPSISAGASRTPQAISSARWRSPCRRASSSTSPKAPPRCRVIARACSARMARSTSPTPPRKDSWA
jgi:hypothetical protein